MDGVKRVSRQGVAGNHASSVDHSRLQKSSTLNRKFVKKPVAKPKMSAAASAAARTMQRQGYERAMLNKGGTVRLQPATAKTQAAKAQAAQPAAKAQTAKAQAGAGQESPDVYVKNEAAAAARERQAAKRQATQGGQQLTAQQLKDRAIQQALSKMNTVDKEEKRFGKLGKRKNENQLIEQFGEENKQKKHFWQNRKLTVAAVMAVISICLLGYLVHLNLPDISVRVAAMQTGIEKAYPSYIPATYRLDGLVHEDNGRITMNFKNDQDHKFTLLEEKSSWDSAAVLANYVKKNWGDDYSIAKGQGLTIYISGSNAVWVNGGVLYMINDDGGHLSSGDLHDIAVSL